MSADLDVGPAHPSSDDPSAPFMPCLDRNRKGVWFPADDVLDVLPPTFGIL
jgi:hypothetical protein